MRSALKNVTRINRNGSMWYVFVPKAIKAQLEEYGIRLKDYVIWEKVERVSDNEVKVELRIVKAGVQQ